ncbi:MAG: rhodanese-like domain-containing protein [Longimicrobiales bacterium]|nr:rhodanese-like domain-containing protein [Longimicrobiales bacterium]
MKYARAARIAAMVVMGLGVAACSDAPDARAGQVAADSDVVYVDVRTQEEFEAGHVEGAIHIPHTEMAERYGELESYEDREIVLYCRSGRRSGIAQSILEEHGFDNVVNGGGLRDLQARGVPTTR